MAVWLCMPRWLNVTTFRPRCYLSMPRMDGEESLRAIRAVDQDVPIIICSGYDEREATSRFSSKEISGFIQKPYSLEDLYEMLAKAMGGN